MTPNFIMLLLTHKCNLDCKYCYLEDKSTIPDKESFMSADTLRKAITNIAINYVKNGDNQKITLQFAGGEPTLLGPEKIDEYYTIVEDILKAYDIPYSLSLITNGTTMNKEMLDVLMKHHVGTCISLDGLHNIARYTKTEEIQSVVNTIKLIQDAGYSFSIHTVLTDDTKDRYLEECRRVTDRYDDVASVTVVRDYKYKMSPNDEDVLKYYFISALEKFINGQVTDLNSFYNLGPGRYLLKYLTDRFTYHTNYCRTSCGAKYCGGGINLAAITPDGYWQMCADFRGDEDFFNGRSHLATENDFLNLKKIQENMNFTLAYLPRIKKCDKCQHQYYCDYPCMLYMRKKYGKWEIPESYCNMMNELYQWYENHLNSILKAIYQYSDSHSVRIREDRIYQRINNDRLDSKYFGIEVCTDEKDPLFNHIIVGRK